MGRGHYVSFDGEPDTPRPERSSRLRQFEAVVVLWTETSWQNAGLAEIARETLPHNLLVPVRSEQLAAARLPLTFRKLNMLGPRDVDGIARLVARLSMAASSLRDMAERDTVRRAAEAARPPEAPQTKRPPSSPVRGPQKRAEPNSTSGNPKQSAGYAPPIVEEGTVRARPLSGLPEVDSDAPGFDAARREPSPEPAYARDAGPQGNHRRPHDHQPPPPAMTADDLARAVEAGLLVHHIPEAMWLGAPTTVELTLGREVLAGLMLPEAGGGFANSLETISVSLYGSSEAFEIERQSERTQFVSAKHIVSVRDPETFGRWAWLVTPRTAGPQDMVVRVSALLRDRRGVPAPVALPDRCFSVEIQVPEGQSLISALAGWRRR
jgi:hypothetical protein